MNTVTQQGSNKNFLLTQAVEDKFQKILGDKSNAFTSTLLSVVNSNYQLAQCDHNSIFMSAALSATLDLPINPNLGFAYIVPYRNKDGKQVAQLQVGYKGFIQLAHRTGAYKRINVMPIYKGQIKQFNPLEEIYEFDFSLEKTSTEVIGYAAFFELNNGFKKTIYWNVGKIIAHASKYSKSYSNVSGIWKSNFDDMAQKTLIKHMLSKYGILSVDVVKAIEADQTEVKNVDVNGNIDVEYVDTAMVTEVVEEKKTTTINL